MTRLLSIAETCVRAGCSDSTVRRLIKAGRLQAVKVGSLVRVMEESLDQLSGKPEPAKAKN